MTSQQLTDAELFSNVGLMAQLKRQSRAVPEERLASFIRNHQIEIVILKNTSEEALSLLHLLVSAQRADFAALSRHSFLSQQRDDIFRNDVSLAELLRTLQSQDRRELAGVQSSYRLISARFSHELLELCLTELAECGAALAKSGNALAMREWPLVSERSPVVRLLSECVGLSRRKVLRAFQGLIRGQVAAQKAVG